MAALCTCCTHTVAWRARARLQLVARQRVEHQVRAAPASAAPHERLKRARAAVADALRVQAGEAREQRAPLRLRAARRVHLWGPACAAQGRCACEAATAALFGAVHECADMHSPAVLHVTIDISAGMQQQTA